MEFFMVKNKESLADLKCWLKNHRYNSYSYGSNDKKGNSMIPIRWDRAPDSDWGKPEKATGIILIPPKLKDMFDEVEKVVIQGKS